MHLMGRIDRDIYKCITEDIRTDEVFKTVLCLVTSYDNPVYKERDFWGGKFRTIHTPQVLTGETQEMQEKRAPAQKSLFLFLKTCF